MSEFTPPLCPAGEPQFRQLEPAGRVVEADWGASAGGV